MSAEASGWTDMVNWTVVANLVTWIFVWIGWNRVHQATLGRERRKEKRDAAKAVIVELLELEEQAVSFHTAPAFEPQKWFSLRLQNDRMIRRLQRPPFEELKLPNKSLVSLRQNITDKNTGATTFISQPHYSPMVSNIRAAVDDLIEDIETQRDSVWK
jgi:hypothetical protein